MSADSLPSQRQLEVYKGLVEVSALINGIVDSRELLPAILDVARRVMNAEAASLFLVNADADLDLSCQSREGEGSGPPPSRIVVPRGRGISGWVLEHGKPLLVEDAYADPRFYREADKQTGFRTRSILCAPLLRNGKEIGVLQVLNPVGRDAFDEADLSAFEAYGNLAATAIDKLRTIDQRREQQRIEQELNIARDIQASFLPQTLPTQEGVAFAAAYRPAREVGGDFYDVVEMGKDSVYFVIGDVSGKGMPAALLMAQALSTLRLILQPRIAPGTVLSRWNDMLCGRTIRGMFITALIGRVDCNGCAVELASAGHCHPFLTHRGGGAREIEVPGGPPLGIVPNQSARTLTLALAPGECLAAFTDGLSEAFNAERKILGSDGIARLLEEPQPNARSVVEALQRGEEAHRGRNDPHDDLTILAFGCP
jgi:sigma-B regulation protein RsbU (phosphoserine phosphatase)